MKRLTSALLECSIAVFSRPGNGLSRREFVAGSSAGLVSVWTVLALGGCGGASQIDSAGSDDPLEGGLGGSAGQDAGHPGNEAGGHPGNEAGSDAEPAGDVLQPTCGELTEPNIEGPFFTPGSPERTSLREASLAGVPLLLSGRVLGPDCRVLAGALLDFWQADSTGAYDNTGFRLRGHQYTDAEGRYVLETIMPGHYLNGSTYRPAHIHVKVGAPRSLLLTTQLYFEGDPYNDIDPFIVPSLIMPLRDAPGGVKLAQFDFVLAPSA